MKTLLPTLLFSLYIIGSSFVYEEKIELIEEALVVPDIYPIRVQPYTLIPTYYSGPSTNEVSLQAKLDSHLVFMNTLHDSVDSLQLMLTTQSTTISKLELQDRKNEARIKKEKQALKKEQQRRTWIITFLGIAVIMSVFFAYKWRSSEKS